MKFLEFWIKEEDTDGKAYLRPASLGEVKEVLNYPPPIRDRKGIYKSSREARCVWLV